MNNILCVITLLFIGCGPTESTALTLFSIINFQSNDCSGIGVEEACTDASGNLLDEVTTQDSCVTENFNWTNYYQEWLNTLDDPNSFSTIMDPNNNTCTITYDEIELIGDWDSNSCKISNSTITSGICVEFIFTEN